MVVELVLPYVSCRPSLVSAPTKHRGGCTAGCHSCSPPSAWLTLGVTLGSCWWRCCVRGSMLLLLHVGQIQSSTEV